VTHIVFDRITGSAGSTGSEMQHADLTKQIIGCAYNVFNTLGAGFLESVYRQSLLIELREAGLDVESQVSLDVFYRTQLVGCFLADIIVENTAIVELKAIDELAKIHEVQLVNYLVATGKPVGLLINFGPSGVEVRRKVRELKSLPSIL
jgi:GxxExxY protein